MEVDGLYYNYDVTFPYDRMPSLQSGGVPQSKNIMENFYFADSNEKDMVHQLPSLNVESIAEMKYQFPGDMLNIQSQNESFNESRGLSMLQNTPAYSSDDEKISAIWDSFENFNDVIPTPEYGSDPSVDSYGHQADPFYHDPFLNYDSNQIEVSAGRARSNSSLSIFDSNSGLIPISTMEVRSRNRSASNPSSMKGAKVFHCHLCPTTFSRNHDLKRHIRIHLGIRPHKCQTCPKTFTRADALNRHVNVRGCRGI